MTRPFAGLSWNTAGREALAGVTLVAIAVPLNIGYAQIAGLPATAGLYAMIVPLIVYTLVVSSRQLVASPDAAAAALVASSLGGLAIAGSADYLAMALAQALLSGVMFVLAAVFRLGFLADFLSKPILIGFVGGLALDILLSQVAKMLGVGLEPGSEFVEKLVQLVTRLPEAHLASALIAAASILVLVFGRRLVPMVPWALLVLVVATIVTVAFSLQDHGVATLGAVESGPPRLTWPQLDLGTWLALVPSALALTLVTMAEGLLLSRTYAERRGYRTDANRDLLAFGAANLAAGVTGAFAVGSSTSRTAAMDQAGSRTQLPSIVAAVATLLLLLFGTGLLEDVPSPAIGAIVAMAILRLVGVAELRELWTRERAEFAIAAVCFLATLLIGAIPGILIALVLSLVNLARRAARPTIEILREDEIDGVLLETSEPGAMTAPGVLVVRLGAPLFFANASSFSESVTRALHARDEVRHLVIDLGGVSDIDVTGAEALERVRAQAAEDGVRIAFTRARPRLLARMTRLGVHDGERVFVSNRAALAAFSHDTAAGEPPATDPAAAESHPTRPNPPEGDRG